MKKTAFLILTLFIFIIMVRCNNGNKFVGTWKEIEKSEISGEYDLLKISKNGENFILEMENKNLDAGWFNGIYTLSKEGCLTKSLSPVTIIVDEKTGNLILSNSLDYLHFKKI